MIRVYAVTEDTGEPLPYDSVRAGDLMAVVERVESTPEPEPEELWGHEHVVEQLMADRAVLPMRFGTTQPDEAALRSALMERHEELRGALDRVRGRVELSVRAVGGPVEPAPAATGREWLGARLEAARLADAVHEPLAAVAVAERRRPATGEVLRAAYLVDRAALDRFRAALDGVRRARPELDIVCTGPWPPYSFVQ